MSITAITIENFKGIADAVTIPIRPLTLLFGKNSAGKSTVLQALHYVREVLEHRRPDPDRTQMGGDYIDLGGFQSLVHRNDLRRKIRIRVEFDVDDDGIPNFGITSLQGDTEESRALSLDLNGITTIKSAWIEVVTAWEMHRSGGAYVAEYAVGLDGEPFIRLQQAYGLHPELLSMNFMHPLMQALDQQYAQGNDDPVSLSERMRFLYHEDEASGVSDVYAEPVLLNEQESIIPDWDRPFLVDDDFQDTAIYQDPETQFPFWSLVGQALTGPLGILVGELKGIRYVGPIRDVPPRNYRTPKTPDESRWAKGLGAWDILSQNKNLTELVSLYLQETLSLGYSIHRQERVSLDLDGDIMTALRFLSVRMSERFEDLDVDELQRVVVDELEQLPRQVVVQVHDDVNDIDVDPSDIGVGISQIIPVLVGALDIGSRGHRCRLFAVEQPELHVHPAVQVALGDVFIDAIKNSDRTMLIETHSEHLLLRLLRRVRETSEKTPAPKERALKPDDLSVMYVLPTEEGTAFTTLAVTDDGDFDTPWPEGFFDERDSELF